ncbi:hypothetical protein NMY22_g17156 [Coprinellus aureogranulatus]|nr:hypothetical protein NMY22_g17156 [Coprinellus aureogranulatus]
MGSTETRRLKALATSTGLPFRGATKLHAASNDVSYRHQGLGLTLRSTSASYADVGTRDHPRHARSILSGFAPAKPSNA